MSSLPTITRRRRTWFVGNQHDPHDAFEVQADSYENALAAALAELGWSLVFESDEALEAVYLGGDQPVTCPQCGRRTAIEALDETRQRHTCLGCAYVFIVEFEDEEDADEDG